MTGKILYQQVKKTVPLCMLVFMVAEVSAMADVIVFKSQNAQQTGTVIKEDDSGITIRFSKDAIQSISKGPDKTEVPDSSRVIMEEKNGFHILKIPDHLLQIQSSEKQVDNPGTQQKAANIPVPETNDHQGPVIQNKLIEEEMGAVKGRILWQNKPMHGPVKIVLTKYTGFSIAALKKMFPTGSSADSTDNEIVLSAQTNTEGTYSFPNVPPGSYRLYWLPAGETEWIHRLRDKPDFEVIAGSMTIQNIPEK